jgi:hypothetical protein
LTAAKVKAQCRDSNALKVQDRSHNDIIVHVSSERSPGMRDNDGDSGIQVGNLRIRVGTGNRVLLFQHFSAFTFYKTSGT